MKYGIRKGRGLLCLVLLIAMIGTAFWSLEKVGAVSYSDYYKYTVSVSVKKANGRKILLSKFAIKGATGRCCVASKSSASGSGTTRSGKARMKCLTDISSSSRTAKQKKYIHCSYYFYTKWSTYKNSPKVSTLFNYIRTGRAANGYSASDFDKIIKAALKLKVPDRFKVYYCQNKSEKYQNFIAWKMTKDQVYEIELQKSSSDDKVNNPFDGIEYTVYGDDKKTVKGVLKLDETGMSQNPVTLSSAGTYYVKETKTNEYYAINDQWIKVSLTSSNPTETVITEDKPAKGYCKVKKVLSDDSSRGGSCEGFRFIIKSASEMDVQEEDEESEEDEDSEEEANQGTEAQTSESQGTDDQSAQTQDSEVQTTETQTTEESDSEEGEDQTDYEGDDDYVDDREEYVGYTNSAGEIKEWKSTDLDTRGEVAIDGLAPGKYIIYEDEEYLKNKFPKYTSVTKKPMEFTVSEGSVSQIRWTNRYDNYKSIVITKTTNDGSSPEGFEFEIKGPEGFEPVTRKTDGDGRITVEKIDIYGTYTIEEKLTKKQLQHYEQGGAKKVEVLADGPESVEVPYVNIHKIVIATTATSDSGRNYVTAGKGMVVKDTVMYNYVEEGREYDIKGILMDKETGNPALDDYGDKIEASNTFTPQSSQGSTDVIFKFDGENLKNCQLVAFEEMYKEGKLVASHKDIDDEAQMVSVTERRIPITGTSDEKMIMGAILLATLCSIIGLGACLGRKKKIR